jgi:hypothetical protein
MIDWNGSRHHKDSASKLSVRMAGKVQRKTMKNGLTENIKDISDRG